MAVAAAGPIDACVGGACGGDGEAEAEYDGEEERESDGAGARVGVDVTRRCTVAGMYAMLIDGRLANMHISAEHVALTAMVYVTVGSSAEMFFCTPSVTE